MRIASGYDLIDLYSRTQDGIWRSSSPTPAPKYNECSCPESAKSALCAQQGFRIGKRCYDDIPCEHKTRGTVASLEAQVSKSSHSPVPYIPQETRKQRRLTRLASWVEVRLQSYETPASNALLGADIVVGLEDYDSLADLLWRDYESLPRAWK